MLRDLLWLLRFRRRRRASAAFQRLCAPAQMRWSFDPRIEPHLDGVFWAARPQSGYDGELWLVGDRLFHGWPDPPEWAFFALSPAGEIRCAADFDHWPQRWARPAEPAVPRCVAAS